MGISPHSKKFLPKVSILIPTYNQENIIEETLRSALTQSYPNIEVVVSDDASTDSTPEILTMWQKKHLEKLKVFLHRKNVGITQNHNRGLRECSGDFITFLDGDDIFLPDKVEKQLDFMLRHSECTIAYHNVDVFNSATGKRIYFWSDRFGTRQGSIKELVRFGNYLPAVSVMIREKDMPKQGYNERIDVYSDWLFWLQTLRNGKGKICYQGEVLSRYRRHDKNMTNLSAQKFIDLNLVLDFVENTWSDLLLEARMRRSEIQFMQAINYFSKGKYRLSKTCFLSSLKLGFPYFPWFRLVVREMFFLLKNDFTMDKILRSILHG